ncbi:MAG: phosphoribosyl-AMP cyclohydrolase [Dermatophilaceae bacterium]
MKSQPDPARAGVVSSADSVGSPVSDAVARHESADPPRGARCVPSALDPTIAARLRRDADGLIAAVIQQYDSGQVLMVGWMDDEALHSTLTAGRVTFWSRSRQQYWRKGDTSGHVQFVRSVALDCDGDAVLVRVDQVGAACHTGQRTCFFTNLAARAADVPPLATSRRSEDEDEDEDLASHLDEISEGDLADDLDDAEPRFGVGDSRKGRLAADPYASDVDTHARAGRSVLPGPEAADPEGPRLIVKWGARR